MSIEERLEAIAMNLELASRQGHDTEKKLDRLATTVERLADLVKQDGENIRGLARIAEIHEQRISGIEGSQS